MMRTGMVGLLALLAVSGCKKGEDNSAPSQRSAAQGDTVRSAAKGTAVVGGQGQLLAAGRAADLRLSPDGQFATFLLNGQKPRLDGIPPQMLVGSLHVVPTAGGKSRALGDGVTNVPGSLLFSQDSKHLLYVTGYNPASQSGELNVLSLTDAASEPVKLGTAVSYLLPSPDGVSVAFVDAGTLKLGKLPQGPFQDVAGEVSTAQFTPDGKTLLFKRRLSAAGGLAAVTVGSTEAPRKLADQVGDYQVSSDGKHVAYQVRSEAVRGMYDLYLADVPALKGTKLATGTKAFGFSPDGQWLARTENGKPEQMGDLHVGPASGGAGRKVGEAVEEMAFAPDSKAVAFLEKYDQPSRAGALGVASLPDGAPKRVGDRVPNFVWGSDSRYVAFLSRFVKPVFSVDLMLYALGQEKAEKVQPGVFGYGFAPNNSAVVFRTNCIRNGRACDFKAVELNEKQAEAKTWMQGIFSYKISEDGARVLATYARMDADTYDVAVYDVKSGARKTLDQGVQVPVYFAGKDDARAVYIIGQGQNPGVYSAVATAQ
ncbi:gliding motility protein [Corallococcus exiguus]|uniref:gliding motility protein n=1 Tax=Corallococcus TaxID=83461 RepID=UPI000EEC3689|nr:MULTISPECIES: gliding motility protein [Corallococcus]NNB97892.1 gliding motility protein [Corallococcus exiguus]NNC06780.1 gliding motility protein [Corallococcus exiguus]NPC50598.1 gliding motility protein [Corallococcus exiguus]RKH78210.1 gliding motility protein [Corallococcus sp. AB032C]